MLHVIFQLTNLFELSNLKNPKPKKSLKPKSEALLISYFTSPTGSLNLDLSKSLHLYSYPPNAAAPPTISASSFVIASCLALL